MATLILVIAIIVIIRGVITLLSLLTSIIWLTKNTFRDRKNKLKSQHPEIYILIPVLREQKNIIDTLSYLQTCFASPNVRIVVITTQREFEKPFDGLSTKALVNDYIQKNKLSEAISCIDYPDKNGNMANQLNFAIKNIENGNAFIVVYNADSRPEANTFKNFYYLLSKYPEARVFQQSGIYLKNFKTLNIFLKTQAIWQTRWSLAHEVPRLIRQSLSTINFVKTYANVNCVGHGLFIKLDELKNIGMFSEKMMNEDTFLAYILKSKGVSIYPIPGLDLSDSPTTLKSLWNQKYVWYWGPLQYPKYLIYVLKNKKKLEINKITIPIILFIQGMISATSWLISAPIVILLLLSPIFTNFFGVLLSYIGLIIYGPLQATIVYLATPLLLRHFDYKNNIKLSLSTLVGIILFDIPAVIFYGIPPYFALFSELKHMLTGQNVYKPKTES